MEADRTIVITGASSGIGRATAELFIADGWNVALVARRAELLDRIAAGAPRARGYPCDVTDRAAVDATFAAIAADFGRVDVLFNNAGAFGPTGLVDEIDAREWDALVALNITGMFNAARAAFRHMRRQRPAGGRIINNGSVSAQAPRPGAVAYTTTKHAITGLTRSLSLDGRPFDIACGQIDIGNARTELLEEVIARSRAADPAAPETPTMDVRDAARAVHFMADLPLSANVQHMTIMATKMPLVGRG
ncbi:MAG: SDR family oxidoreductase [Alphaproteobacteria bacterium]|nr:MAG: SDR family oxidoreductase [Alphaproteobacteria bacterium]